jgi:adenosylcobinamide kinase / adenosylcobinamide-phosphate guanylyltransferase
LSSLTLILGGARSGKSSFAEKVAWEKGGSSVIYLATSEIGDEEMEDRVRIHRQNRPSVWKTLEEPYQISKVLATLPAGQLVLLDCITLFVSNMLLQGKDVPGGQEFDVSNKEAGVMQEIEKFIAICYSNELNLVIVSNEVGQGLVPTYQLGRQFRDIMGRANQILARAADEVYFCIAGLPVEIKEIGMRNLARFE